MRLTALCSVAIGLTALAVACGGGNSSPSSPSPTPTPTTTITITSAGVSPRDVTVSLGSRVTFVNNNSAAHDMSSDPHPDHTGCPEITVGNVPAGQSRATNNLNTARTCRFHDHFNPGNTGLQGTIRIQ